MIKESSKIWFCFALLIGLAIICRLIPMPAGVYGITPMYAMAIFGGALFRKDRKFAFLIPILSFFACDVLIQALYSMHLWSTPGFYSGQLTNYILFALLTFVGFGIRRPNVGNVVMASLIAPTIFYLLSNLAVWAFAGFYPMTLTGLKSCYVAGWPFYFPYSLVSTIVFSGVLFGAFELWKSKSAEHQAAHN